jgi:shikimate dehydrogenase
MADPALRFAVIGSPIEHSLSPLMHRAAFAALGLKHVYERVETTREDLPRRIAELKDGTFAGLNVTVPLKEKVLDLVDEISSSVRAIGAANTLVRGSGGIVVAHNTDAPALRQELEQLGDGAGLGPPRSGGEMEQETFRDRSVLVLGSGGAARAALVALATLGANRIIVRGRNVENASKLATIIPGITVEVQALEAPAREREDLAGIVQATTCGMLGGPAGEQVATAVHWESVPSDAIAFDVVYRPRETPFLHAARARGLVCDDGTGMLARQGALAAQLWLGIIPPVDVMRQALLQQNP